MERDPSSSIARRILAAESAPPPVNATIFNAALDVINPCVKPLYTFVGAALDYVYLPLFRTGFWLYKTLPLDLFTALTGVTLSFCGGAYTASIAAIEAFRITGWETTRAALLDVYADLNAIWTANKFDDVRLAESEISGQELATHKLAVWACAIRDPEKLSRALGGLYGSWCAVQGVLRLEFARTITIGVSIAELATPMLERICVPFLAHTVPKPYHHWIPLLVKTAARAIGVALAWRVQTFVSAIHLALRGGLMCSRALLRWANGKGLVKVDEDETYIDEVLGYSIALCGFYFQLTAGFDVPFPLNFLMLPFSAVEYYVRWTITSNGGAEA